MFYDGSDSASAGQAGSARRNTSQIWSTPVGHGNGRHARHTGLASSFGRCLAREPRPETGSGTIRS